MGLHGLLQGQLSFTTQLTTKSRAMKNTFYGTVLNAEII
jgi:hypothetical protein